MDADHSDLTAMRRVSAAPSLGLPQSRPFAAYREDGAAIGAAQFLRPDNMQSSWRDISISFINKK
jgi:hypothetical protein